MGKLNLGKLMSNKGGISDEQFKVLFYIYNTILMNIFNGNGNRVKIYRAVLADLTGKSERTISRITNKLVEQGFVIKTNVSSEGKLYSYYSLPCQEINSNLVTERQETTPNLVTGDRVNNNNINKRNNTNYTNNTKYKKEESTGKEEDAFQEYMKKINLEEMASSSLS